MAIKTVVEDYLLAAMKRAEVARAKNGTLVLTVPEFPGVVACGANPPECLEDLYRRLERWVLASLAGGYTLPPMTTSEGVIDLNTEENRALAAYHQQSKAPKDADAPTFIGGPDELEAYLADLGHTD
jgi:hypothetical protein